jgi:regulator of protease activity HflC (stomatin/prohibitin superfamily)
MEKIIKPMSGYLVLVLSIVSFVAAIICMANGVVADRPTTLFFVGIALLIVTVFLFMGITIINPNHSRVCVFFGKYIGTVKDNGLKFINPLFRKINLSLRAQNLESSKLKVNDKMGNPIEIGAVIVWQVSNTYKAAFEVANYDQYIKVQCEAAIRHLANSFPYDNLEDEKADITLRNGAEKVSEILEVELNERLAPAGLTIIEARISHLAYSAEIAGAMLQRQQATAIVAARTKIVEGAVGMVEMALEMLAQKQIVTLDDERKAAMVSNLMVVLCGERGAQPVLNTGTLYQ